MLNVNENGIDDHLNIKTELNHFVHRSPYLPSSVYEPKTIMGTSPYRYCVSHQKKLKFICAKPIICNGDIGRKKCGKEFFDKEEFHEHVQSKHKKCEEKGCNYFAAAKRRQVFFLLKILSVLKIFFQSQKGKASF